MHKELMEKLYWARERGCGHVGIYWGHYLRGYGDPGKCFLTEKQGDGQCSLGLTAWCT